MTRYDMYVKTESENRTVVVKNGKWGVIDNDENVIIPIDNDEIIIGEEAYVFVLIKREGLDKKYGLFDFNGQCMIPIEYDGISLMLEPKTWYKIEKNHKYGMFDTKVGQIIVPCIYDDCATMRYVNNEAVWVSKKGLCGVVDTDGREIIPLEYDDIWSIPDGYICNKGKYYGVRDKHSKPVIAFKYTAISMANAQKTGVLFCCNGKKEGLIKSDGEIILPCEYDAIHYMFNDIFKFFDKKTGKYGVVFTDSKIKTDVKYDDVTRRLDYIIVERDGKQNILTGEAEERFPWNFQEIRDVSQNPELFLIKEYGRRGIIKADGTYLLPPKYFDIEYFIEGTAIVKNDDVACGLIDLEGKEIIPIVYDSMVRVGSKYMKVGLGRKYGLLETNGKVVLPVIYDDIYGDVTDNAIFVKYGRYDGVAPFID